MLEKSLIKKWGMRVNRSNLNSEKAINIRGQRSLLEFLSAALRNNERGAFIAKYGKHNFKILNDINSTGNC